MRQVTFCFWDGKHSRVDEKNHILTVAYFRDFVPATYDMVAFRFWSVSDGSLGWEQLPKDAPANRIRNKREVEHLNEALAEARELGTVVGLPRKKAA